MSDQKDTNSDEDVEKEQKESGSQKKDGSKNLKVKTRKSPKDYIIDRKNKKIKDLKKKAEKKAKKKVKDDVEKEGKKMKDIGEDELQSRINKAVEPLFDKLEDDYDEKAIKGLKQKYGKEKVEKIEPAIRKYMKHSAYRQVPAEFIFLALAKEKLDAKDQADLEALENSTGGSQRRPKKSPKIPDVEGMDPDEFRKLKDEVKTGRFNK